MSLDDSAVACARIVEKGDPDRFRTVMAAPVATRAALFALYAFNVEVARAPWLTQEAMIAEMRLQWWRDVLEEISTGQAVRKHEVSTPLAALLSPTQAERLDTGIAARRWDIYREPFEDQAHMDAYIDQTAGHLMWTACEVLGARPEAEQAVRGVAFAAGVAAFLRAVPTLAEAGRIPLLDGTHQGLADLARRAKGRLAGQSLPRRARPAMWPALGAGKTLDHVIRDPAAVGEGRLLQAVPPFGLAWAALTGR